MNRLQSNMYPPPALKMSAVMFIRRSNIVMKSAPVKTKALSEPVIRSLSAHRHRGIPFAHRDVFDRPAWGAPPLVFQPAVDSSQRPPRATSRKAAVHDFNAVPARQSERDDVRVWIEAVGVLVPLLALVEIPVPDGEFDVEREDPPPAIANPRSNNPTETVEP